ncbi:MAG: hypothetical protein ACFB9M_21355 [Myxococcota bacterium]
MMNPCKHPNPRNGKTAETRLGRLYLAGLVATVLLTTPSPALAYVGPGAGLGAIAVTVALLLGVLLLAVGLVWYPLKRFLRTFKRNEAANPGNGPTDGPE